MYWSLEVQRIKFTSHEKKPMNSMYCSLESIMKLELMFCRLLCYLQKDNTTDYMQKHASTFGVSVCFTIFYTSLHILFLLIYSDKKELSMIFIFCDSWDNFVTVCTVMINYISYNYSAVRVLLLFLNLKLKIDEY